jgi:hypothetical protein
MQPDCSSPPAVTRNDDRQPCGGEERAGVTPQNHQLKIMHLNYSREYSKENFESSVWCIHLWSMIFLLLMIAEDSIHNIYFFSETQFIYIIDLGLKTNNI